MSGLDPSLAVPGARAVPVPALAAARPLLAWVRACAERARQRRALSRLDDRLLRDIGVSRSEVDAEQAKWAWRR
jgi:uncharacterized protein YjiS (DUF1127 family)